jgi:DNA-binding transcriptional MerR regulator
MAKGPNAFRTISEAADEVGVPQHVLRFWETKFTFVDPLKRAGGRRFYRPQDIMVLQGVRRLLHDEGLTIKGVQRLHRERGMARITGGDEAAPSAPATAAARVSHPEPSPDSAPRLRALAAHLERTRAHLDAALKA